MEQRKEPLELLHAVERLNWTLTAIGKVSSVLVRAETEFDLFTGACEAICFQDVFALAWIGLPQDDDMKSVAVHAKAGKAQAYLDDIEVSWSEDSPFGGGPSGKAIRSGQTQFNNNMLSADQFRPWRDKAGKFNLRSSFSAPVRLPNGPVIATLVVYSETPKAFGELELSLFSQLGDDIGFGVDALRTRAARKQAETAVNQERLFSSAMMESTPGVIYNYDRDGNFLRWNYNFQAVSGYSAAEIARMKPLDFISDEGKQLVAERIEEVFATGESIVEAALLTKAGRKIPYLFTGRRMIMDGKAYLIGVGIDISERKESEIELADYASRLRSASRQLLAVQENERRLLGRELHDSVGQELAALNLNLTILRDALPDDLSDSIVGRLDDSQALLEEASRHLRDVMTELRPPGLDELGLMAALTDHSQRVARRSGVRVSITGGDPVPRLDPTAEIALFRIVQEGLNNAVKHAQASDVSIVLTEPAGHLILSLSDNGVGFDPNRPRGPLPAGMGQLPTGMGMITMRERAEAVGGRFILTAMPGGGTRVTVTLPR